MMEEEEQSMQGDFIKDQEMAVPVFGGFQR